MFLFAMARFPFLTFVDSYFQLYPFIDMLVDGSWVRVSCRRLVADSDPGRGVWIFSLILPQQTTMSEGDTCTIIRTRRNFQHSQVRRA